MTTDLIYGSQTKAIQGIIERIGKLTDDEVARLGSWTPQTRREAWDAQNAWADRTPSSILPQAQDEEDRATLAGVKAWPGWFGNAWPPTSWMLFGLTHWDQLTPTERDALTKSWVSVCGPIEGIVEE